MRRKGKLFVISGPSGSGKTTIVKKVLETMENVKFSVSYTTRSRRKGEKDGVDYKFVTRAEFEEMIKRKEFLEWSEVHGNLYGTPVSSVVPFNEKGIDVLLDIDVKGARNIKKSFADAVFIFVLPENMEELKKRLESRESERERDIVIRLETAKEEIAQIVNYDYIIFNKKLEESVDQLASIIKAERCRRDDLVVEEVMKNFGVRILSTQTRKNDKVK